METGFASTSELQWWEGKRGDMSLSLRPEPPDVTYHHHSHSTGENLATWPPLTARRAGKYNPAMHSGRKGDGFGWVTSRISPNVKTLRIPNYSSYFP